MCGAERDGPLAGGLRTAKRVWRWGWKHRLRVSDWLYAGALFLWLVMTLPNTVNAEVGLARVGESLPLEQVRLLAPALAAVTVTVRRSRPAWLFTAALVLAVVFGVPFLMSFALYSYAVWFTNRRWLAVWSAVMVAGTVAATATITASVWVVVLPVWIVVFIALPLTLGLWMGTRRELIENLRERTARLERERDLEAQNAIAAERTRIAREMHDVVAHRVSLMVLHAGGLEVSAADEHTEHTAAFIRGTGREALAELREILGVLRDHTDGAATAPQPAVTDLPRLVEDWRSTGATVDRRVRGTERPLPAQVERTVYRVAQEALTNAAKHAPGAHVTVELEYGEADVRVVVANGPPPSVGPAPAEQPSGRHGLAGLRERLNLVGGGLVVGPRPDGGWRVRATLPAAADTPTHSGTDVSTLASGAETTAAHRAPTMGNNGGDNDGGTGVDTT
ncbi:sensor histidine kinase [Halostreptopolyspora alba]|uniref:histidine kinase n=1 Tax=Halostreptopolyspora alba TaxID=2487137 RepID=A0A3N0EA72_9ACTN|nr:sensor histidine kinase [Nocardiopsaceae bacterium YIM 96095]